MHQITVTVPIPKTDQNQGHKHWRLASRNRKDDRDMAQVAGMCAVRSLCERDDYGFPWEDADIHIRWYHPTASHRDKWNIVGSLKGTIDGLVRAGLLQDDNRLQPPTVECLTDRKEPRVELVLVRKTLT